MPLFFNPFTGNIEFKPAGSGGGGGITGSGLAGQVTFWSTPASVSGNNNLFWDAINFRLGIGSNTPQSLLNTFEGSTNIIRGALFDQYNIGTEGSRLFLRKSRGAVGLPSVINSGDTIGEILFSGYDSTGFLNSAIIRAVSTGTVLGTRVPSILIFQTSTNTTPSVLTTALTLTETQKATFANNVELTTLSVNDTGGFKTAIDATLNLLRIGAAFPSTSIRSSVNNTLIAVFQGAVSAVNYLQFDNSATGIGPLISPNGSDTNIALRISSKGRVLSTSAIAIIANTDNSLTSSSFTISNTLNAAGDMQLAYYNATAASINNRTVIRLIQNNTTPSANCNTWIWGQSTVPTAGSETTKFGIDILILNVRTTQFSLSATGNSLFGNTKFGSSLSPLAIVDIAPGTTAAAPLKLSTGVLTTGGAILAGNIEFNTDNYYLTGDTGLTRKVIRDLSYAAITIATALDGRNEFVDCTAGTFTVTLPTAIGFLKQYTIFNSGTGVITMGSVLGQSINGNSADTYTLVQYDCIILRSNGANWYKLN